MKKYVLILLATSTGWVAQAQQKWSLQKMVDHAMQNNISVKQADVQTRVQALALKQAKYNQLPNASFNPSIGMQNGRSIDPTTNQFTTTQLLFNSFQIQGGMQVFNFGQIKNNIAFNALQTQAAMADKQRAANDIALQVCNFYLQVLAANEQMRINDVQIKNTANQIAFTKKRVDAGNLPELNLAELEAQLANDSVVYFNGKAIYEQNVLSLKALLNLDMAEPFDIEIPDPSKIPVESLMDLQPQYVYQLAMGNQPQQIADSLRILAAHKNIKATKAGYYPNLNVGYNLATNFAQSLRAIDFNSVQLTGTQTTSQFVEINGSPVFVKQPTFSFNQYRRNFSQWWDGWRNQMDNNFRQSIFVGLSVPIFNSTGNVRIAMDRAKLDLQSNELRKQQNLNLLQQNVYNAYVAAKNSFDRFTAAQKSVQSAQKAYEMAQKRYDVGMLTVLELTTNQNNLTRAQIQQLNNQYDYIFKMKVLEFYKGQGLKL
ncbi:MAG: TolC family protein [Bacteroidetes bacterium]|jgi:outer membrane protein|nr:MAG: TolC family protein [Bacteroidota bacterium]TAE67463.1 MAG: TolC family protein [Bacteroidota bacterium]TAF98358.1 MAG: TolC family protein [Bacteroidota bacterium]